MGTAAIICYPRSSGRQWIHGKDQELMGIEPLLCAALGGMLYCNIVSSEWSPEGAV